MSQSFPDQLYLDRIRVSLWRRGTHGSAAVMVGAGMSLNAQPRGAASGRFPYWSDLAKTVVDHLYPAHGEANSVHREQALQQVHATSGFLRLAQEYETAFGREALERLIADAVPDLRFEPGDLHKRLLALPWSDVFTTNWDTLLERAATHVVDRHYDVVRTAADIPGSARPRIVKLHGTLPAIRPLIFTEDDFRTYPVRFAPFVNLAQQSMMESIFCLIGFSGDDPNFLYWAGWVRDHLRDYAPSIYLVGWLDLSPPRRRMLEKRGVVPIDLAHLSLPSGVSWPEETRHQRTLEWFLWSLEAAEPFRKTDWPVAPNRRALQPPAYLPDLLVESTGYPRRESIGPQNSPNVEELRSTLEVWRHNRHLYPGWLVAPHSARSRLWRYTEDWIPVVLELLPALAPTEQIEVLEELNWRLETSLVPLIAELVEVISGAVSVVDPLGSHRDLRYQWVRLLVALLRAAREVDDDSAFERWAEALIPHQPDYSWLKPRIAFERSLLGLARLDHAAVERALDDLETDADDVFWKIRKAGILAELGKTEESFRLAREALPEIRQQLSHGMADIPTLSREGWAMVLAEGFMSYPHPRRPGLDVNSRSTVPRGLEPRERAARRWEVLQHHGCDAREELYETRRVLEEKIPEREPEIIVKLGFDPWHRTRIGQGPSWSSGRGWKHLSGLQAKRLVEEIGLPPIIDFYDLAKSLLRRAAIWLAEPAPGPALGAILRASDYEEDEVFDDFFNRCRIAQLADYQVDALVKRVGRALDYGVLRAAAAMTEKDHERSTYWVSRMRVAVEVLSRLVLRLEGEKAEQVLDRALNFYNLPLFRKHHWLIKPLGHLFSRTLKALDSERIRTRLIQFLALPLPSEGDFRTDSPRDWPDPFLLAAEHLNEAPLELIGVPEWDQIINRLIDAVASTPLLHPRWPAMKRLDVLLLRWGMLTEEQKERLGEALWRHRPPNGVFPEGTELFDFAFIMLPAPDLGIAEELFRQRHLTVLQAPHSLLPTESFQNLVGVAEMQRQGRINLTLSTAQIEQILEGILAVWRSGQLRRAVEDPHAWYTPFDREDYREALTEALGKVILPRLEPASPQIDEAVEMIADLRNLSFPTEATYPALIRLRPDLLPDLCDRLRQSLVSSEREQAEAGVEAVWWWLREGRHMDLVEPPPDLVREIAIAVSMRRPSLQHALRAAEWILRNSVVIEADRFARLVAEGLGYLLPAACYEAGLTRQPTPSFKPTEITEIRILCVKVALALEHAGFGDLHSVGEWIREGQNDPFPEVRHVLTIETTLPESGSAMPSS